MIGTIFDIKEMAVHDGPGIRTTVFFKGCPLRCRWCHNPEGLSFTPQLMYKRAKCTDCKSCQKACQHTECQPFGKCIYACPENCLEIAGREISVKDLASELKTSADILGESFGGFTFSGGEPLAQYEFLLALAEELQDYHLCIETSGYADSIVFEQVVDKLDFVIMDIKLAENEDHKHYTGCGNAKILKNLEVLRHSGKPFIIRTPLIPGITDTDANLTAIKNLIGDSTWEKLPYNAMAGAKYAMLNMVYPLNKEQV